VAFSFIGGENRSTQKKSSTLSQVNDKLVTNTYMLYPIFFFLSHPIEIINLLGFLPEDIMYRHVICYGYCNTLLHVHFM